MIYWIFILITAFCTLVSGYLSYWGFQRNFGELSLVFALIIFLVLVGANLGINKSIRKGRGSGRAVLLLMIGVVFSFASNFNRLYTTAMRTDAAEAVVQDEYRKFMNNLDKIEGRLLAAPSYKRFQTTSSELNVELKNLRDQMLDRLNKGCGRLSRQHIQKVNDIIGHNLTATRCPGSSASTEVIKAWLDDYSARAKSVLRKLPHNARIEELESVLQLIADDRVRASPNEVKQGLTVDDISEGIRQYSANIEKFESKANSVLGALGEREISGIEKISFAEGRLGEIVYTYSHALKMKNPGETFLSAVLALIVDLLPWLFSVLGFASASGDSVPSGRYKRANGDGPML